MKRMPSISRATSPEPSVGAVVDDDDLVAVVPEASIVGSDPVDLLLEVPGLVVDRQDDRDVDRAASWTSLSGPRASSISCTASKGYCADGRILVTVTDAAQWCRRSPTPVAEADQPFHDVRKPRVVAADELEEGTGPRQVPGPLLEVREGVPEPQVEVLHVLHVAARGDRAA